MNHLRSTISTTRCRARAESRIIQTPPTKNTPVTASTFRSANAEHCKTVVWTHLEEREENGCDKDAPVGKIRHDVGHTDDKYPVIAAMRCCVQAPYHTYPTKVAHLGDSFHLSLGQRRSLQNALFGLRERNKRQVRQCCGTR